MAIAIVISWGVSLIALIFELDLILPTLKDLKRFHCYRRCSIFQSSRLIYLRSIYNSFSLLLTNAGILFYIVNAGLLLIYCCNSLTFSPKGFGSRNGGLSKQNGYRRIRKFLPTLCDTFTRQTRQPLAVG